MEIIKLQIDKKKVNENLNFCLQLKGCHIVKQDCIIDNNIKSIESAVLFGRTIFKSIRKFIIFQLTMNLIALFLSIVSHLFK